MFLEDSASSIWLSVNSVPECFGSPVMSCPSTGEAIDVWPAVFPRNPVFTFYLCFGLFLFILGYRRLSVKFLFTFIINLLYSRCWIKNGFSISEFQKYLGHDYKRKRGELETCSQEREPVHAKRSAGEWLSVRSTEEFLNHVWLPFLVLCLEFVMNSL